ncbi:MAG: amino acid decarboxylase [Acidobacteria bacterium]|nr:MAG: amino acid decarboxylase [Acidobacteriota bacterium]REK02892.1 MAG: amino acid decarboxylase [Acidobacteriota bacterium]REK13304.1 MAG: amino acid decarboxylase [Acidobacteriota bacterium]REK41298.1 MAG: amino acid decarboxylase [Acidobacteriota bacterium]
MRRRTHEKLGDIPIEEFRKYGKAIVERLAKYYEKMEDLPVLSQIEPGSLKAAMPEDAPEEGEDFGGILEDVEELIFPAVTHWNHPNFHGLFSTSGSSVGVFADMFATAFDMKAMLWRTSPVSTELDEVVLEWLRKMSGLPEGLKGIIYDTASVSTMHAIAMAREKLGLDIREKGMSGRSDLPLLRVYCSEQTHSSIEKSLITLGLGQRSLVKIETDEEYRVRPGKLAEAIEKDKDEGHLPCCVVATIGTTSTTSVDNVEAIGEICKANDIFFHVDMAYAGSAMIVPEFQFHLKGIEAADTIVTNPHKWLFTPFDLSILYVKDVDLLKRTFSLVPEYLATGGEVENQMDYGIQLGRRFRAMKLWFVMRYFGRRGMISRIEDHCRLARDFASWVERSEDFELMADVPFALVCFRACPTGVEDLDEFNERLMNAVNESGEAYISHTKLNGQFVLRLSVGSIRVEDRHIKKVWNLLNEKAATLY